MAIGRKRRCQKRLRDSGNRDQESSPLPEYLLQDPTPPTSIIPPPVHTRCQELPLEKLTWENFERLCKALVETDYEVISCHFYGRPGQKQKGIDLIAYPQDFPDGRPRVYQCKRVEDFGPADIRGTVDKFLKGKRKPLPTHFVLCCRSSLRSTKHQDEIHAQKVRLQKRGIVFEVWDGDELSKKLKDHPKIVDEFFDRGWVTAFNGSDAAEALARRFEPYAAGITDRPNQVMRLILSKELKIQNLESTLDVQLSGTCDQIKEKYKQGRQSEALRDLEAYIDQFQMDPQAASPSVRAKFWYTAGVLHWKLPGGRERANQCLEAARRIDATFDVRPLEARVLFAGKRYDEALQVLQPIDTLPILTLSLATLLDLGRLTEFDAVWSASSIAPDDVAYQLLAYRYRLDRQFDKARDAVHKAIDRAPMIPAHHVAAGHITFWEAIPEHLDEVPRTIPPVAFHPIFYRPTDRQAGLLDKVMQYYSQAASLLSGVRQEEADQIREIQAFQLLCLAYHPHRQVQAKELALGLIAEDPADFSSLFYCIEWDVPFDVDRSIHALETKRLKGVVTLNDLYMLLKLYDFQGHTECAIHLLELERERFIRDKASYVWIGLMVELLVKSGNTSGATELFENYQPDDPLLNRRLEAQFYDRLGDQKRLEEVAVQLYEMSRAMLDLVNLCGFYRKTEQWDKLEPYASQLVDRSPDPAGVSLLAHAFYHNRKYEECLALLDKDTGLFLDAKLPDDLRRIEIECLFKLNRLDKAVTHLEAITHDRPSSSVVQNLAHAYFRMGKREKAVALLREASEAPWADTTLRLAASQLLLKESPEEAFRLARRVREESLGDPGVWLHYIQTGFLTGHDREASEALLLFQGRFPENPLLQRVGLEDLIERVREWRRAQLERWNLYRSAKAPIHIYSDIERQPLGPDWFTWFKVNKSTTRWDQKYPLFVRYGGRTLGEAERNQLDTQGIIIDYTALLLSYELNLLPAVERAFSRIFIPPSLLTLIQVEIQKIAEHQPSRLQVQQQIKTALDAGRIHVISDSLSEDGLQRFQLEELGANGARLFCLAEKYRGLVLAKHLLREEEGEHLLGEPLAGIRVFPLEALTALYRMGIMAQHELSQATQSCSNEPCREDAVQDLAKQPLLVTDKLTVEFFTDLGLLDQLTGAFNVSIPVVEAESITQALQEYHLQQAAADRLDGLRRHISERLNQHYYFPSFPVEVDGEEQGQLCQLLLKEIFRLAQTEHFPVWIDDRFASQYERIEQSPIVGTDDVLVLLKSRGFLSDEEYYRLLIKLMELNTLFLSLDPEMLLHYLRSAGRGQTGEVQETYELKTIRRYFAGAFAEGTVLGVSSLDPGKLPESVLYYHQYRSTCRKLLLKVWSGGDLPDDQKQAISNWIVGRLWKGIEEISHCLLNPPALPEGVALSQHLLISVAFDLLFQKSRAVDQPAGYLSWLYDRFLKAHWEANPDAKRLVINHLASFFKNMTEGTQEPDLRVLMTLSASLLAKAPLEITLALLADDSTRALFKDYIHETVEVSEGLNVPAEEWKQWAFECLSLEGGETVEKNVEGRLLSLQWKEPSPFLAGMSIQFVSEDGTQSTHTQLEPFLKLYHPSPEARKLALEMFTPFLHVSSTKVAELKDRLMTLVGWESAADEVRVIANSSWEYFWERLTHLVRARVPISVDLLFPNDPTMFVTHFPLSPTAFENPSAFRTEWLALVQRKLETDDLQAALSNLLAFPFGEGISSSETITRLIDSGHVSRSQVLEAVIKFAARTTNPVALQNHLDILLALQEGDPSSMDNIQVVVHKLLSPEEITDPTPLVPLYELYITVLRFAWGRMQTLDSFRMHSVRERILWAYAYTGALIEALDSLQKKEDIAAFSQWLTEKIEPSWKSLFEECFNEQIEVSHPMRASRLRTIVSGTFGILLKQKHKLGPLSVGVLAKSAFIAREVIRGEMSGAEEIFKPFSSTTNFFGAPFNQNVFFSLKELLGFFDEDPLRPIGESDRHLLLSMREFDPRVILNTTLHRIVDCNRWEPNDLTSIYVALSEPLDPSLVEILRQTVTHLDLSCWSGEQNFGVACLTLARCANASDSPEVRSMVIEKLRDAWMKIACRTAQYIAILNAVVVVVSNRGVEEKASEFYRWWREAIEGMRGPVPEEVYDIALSLSWWTPITQQQGLSNIKSKLAIYSQ